MPEFLFDRSEFPDLTYDDVFLVPKNATVDKLFDLLNDDELQKLLDLFDASQKARNNCLKAVAAEKISPPERARKRLKKQPIESLTAELQKRNLDAYKAFRSYALEMAARYPELAKRLSRDEVDLTPDDGTGLNPIVVANMNEVAGQRMEEVVTRYGGSVAKTQDKSDEETREGILLQQSRDIRYPTAVTVSPSTKIHEFKVLVEKRDTADTAVVVDSDGIFLGIISKSDIDSNTAEDQSIAPFVQRDVLVTGEEGISHVDAIKRMEAGHVNFLPILTKDKKVLGCLTEKTAALALRYKPNVDSQNRLRVMGTVGALNRNPVDRVKFLIDHGVYDIVMDTANFDQGIHTYNNLEDARTAAEQKTKEVVRLIAGNVVTREAVRNIFAAGGDVAKMGVGPGAMCTTRVKSGVGKPQFSTVADGAEEARLFGKNVWADGGIRHPRDVALALAAGASRVMYASILAPTRESPPLFRWDGDRQYKVNRGMASRTSSVQRGRHLGELDRSLVDIFRKYVGHRSEGLDEGRVYRKPGVESAIDIIHDQLDGISSTAGYLDSVRVADMHKNAVFGVQNASGFAEGTAKSTM